MVKAALFRFILAMIIIVVLESIGYIGIALNSRSFDNLANKSYSRIRAMLMADRDPALYPRYLTLPHLGYIPYPGYQKNGIEQHNGDGYRGGLVPRERDGKYRVLCLGGSTTYGYGVDSPGQTYPAQLQQLLDAHIRHDSSLSRRYTGAEVINAGIEGGTTGEELQQYLFKYRYYRPDAVVVHSGINDALLSSGSDPDFQLDYTDTRRLLYHLEPLGRPLRFMMHSRFLSFLIIRLFYDDFAENGGRDEFKHNGRQTYVHWSHVCLDSIIARKNFEYYPFYRNSRSLYSEIVRDSTLLIVLPNFLNDSCKFVQSSARYAACCALNVSLSHQLCEEYGGIYIPFQFADISDTSCWIGDDCHLTARGERAKGNTIFIHLRQQLSKIPGSDR